MPRGYLGSVGQTCEPLQSSEASLEAPELQATSSASLPLMSSLPQAWSTRFYFGPEGGQGRGHGHLAQAWPLQAPPSLVSAAPPQSHALLCPHGPLQDWSLTHRGSPGPLILCTMPLAVAPVLGEERLVLPVCFLEPSPYHPLHCL